MKNFSENEPTSFKYLDTVLRLFVIPLTVLSIWLIVTNKQDNISYGMLEFSNFSGLKYMVCINAISTGYSLVSISTSWLKCFLTKAWIFFVSDQVIAYLMVTSGAAVVDILYLAYNGDREISWSEACSSYGRFCSRVKVALVLHGFACFCYFGLSMMSACRVFRQFEPPAPSKVVEDETNYH